VLFFWVTSINIHSFRITPLLTIISGVDPRHVLSEICPFWAMATPNQKIQKRIDN
jgi:hypothetical protein